MMCKRRTLPENVQCVKRRSGEEAERERDAEEATSARERRTESLRLAANRGGKRDRSE